MIDTYLISIGDSVNSVLTWILIITTLALLIEIIVVLAEAKVFSDYENPNDDNYKTIKVTIKWIQLTTVILFITLFVKALTPNTEQFIIMSGLNKIKNENYYELPIDVKYLHVNYPNIYGKIDFSKTKEVINLKNDINSKLNIIDSLKNENDSLKQTILNFNK